jgi:hypothetical protein
MRNVSDENCRENQKTYFMFVFSKIVPLMREHGKILDSQTGQR